MNFGSRILLMMMIIRNSIHSVLFVGCMLMLNIVFSILYVSTGSNPNRKGSQYVEKHYANTLLVNALNIWWSSMTKSVKMTFATSNGHINLRNLQDDARKLI